MTTTGPASPLITSADIPGPRPIARTASTSTAVSSTTGVAGIRNGVILGGAR